MKLKINQFVLTLVRAHIFDIATIGAVALCLVVLVFFFLNRLDYYNQGIQSEQTKTSDLKSKVDIINYQQQVSGEGFDFDKLNVLMSRLVPDKEDYFSIIVALETLAQKTNFYITNYEIGLSSDNKVSNEISLTILGQGNQDQFLQFLKDYNFSGNRLITISNVNFNNSGKIEARLDVTFYNGKNLLGDNAITQRLTQSDKNLLRTIEDKVSFTLNDQDTTTNIDYETKQNPFSQ